MRFVQYIILTFVIFPFALAQNVEHIKLDSNNLKSYHDKQTIFSVQPKYVSNSCVIKIPCNQSFDSIKLVIADKIIDISKDEHVSCSKNMQASNLIMFTEPRESIDIKFVECIFPVEVLFIHTGQTTVLKKNASLNGGCEKPAMISQDDWRDGLPEPEFERVVHEVHHIIIHHSATDNNITNFTDLVRSIYVHHTQVNGWSDVGYNYLVAPDGSIFMGRDGGFNEEDNVKGAHFCGANSGTMGICVLGTFTDNKPTNDALSGLEKLIAWKTAKDSLPPYANFNHSLNAALPTIAGHRDGCSTLCPGDFLYENLPDLRDHVNNLLESCDIFLTSLNAIPDANIKLFPNPSASGYFVIETAKNIEHLELYSLDGKRLALTIDEVSTNRISCSFEAVNGLYLIRISIEGQIYYCKLSVI